MRGSSPSTILLWGPAVLGSAIVVASTAAYSIQEGSVSVATPQSATYSSQVALLYFVALAVGLGIASLGVVSLFSKRGSEARLEGKVSLSPSWLLPYIVSERRYRNIFVATSVGYGLFYSLLTGIIVYQPSVDFVAAYGATFPSALVASCCGPPLYAPSVTVYLANHFGLLIVPLTLILMIVISALVGFNFALAGFAFDSRAKGTPRSWIAGVGASVGLFTGCPTCAGLLFANVLGGAGVVSLATAISSYQPAFIAISLPVLAITPYLTSRSLSKVFAEGCVIVPAKWRAPQSSKRLR